MATRDITLDVTIRARTADAAKAEAALKRIDEQAKHAGKSMEGMTGDSKILEAELKKSEQTIKDLDRALLEFGNDKGVRQRLRGERSWLNELKKVGSELETDAQTAGQEVGKSLSAGLQGGVSTPGLGPLLVAGIAEVAALAAPTLGAMLGGAISGAAGTGAMAAGILAAGHDPQVQGAARQFGQDISDQFFASGEAFVDPVLEGLAILEKGIHDSHFGDALAKVAPDVTVIAGGLADMVHNVMPGFNAAMDRMGPFAEVAANGIADAGAAIGDFMDSVTASKGAAEGLEFLFGTLNGTVRFLGDSIEFLSNAFHGFNVLEARVTGGLEDFFHAIGAEDAARGAAHVNDVLERMTGTGENLHGVLSLVHSGLGAANDGFNAFSYYMEHATHATNEFAGALSDLFKGQLDIDKSTLAWKQDILQLKEAVAEHGHSLKDNTEDGLKNQAMIQGLIDDAMRIREATLEQTGSVDQANAAYMRQIDTLKALLEKLGFTKQKIDDLVGDYEVNVRVNVFGVQSTGTASRVIHNLLAEDRLSGARASGGPVSAGGAYLVGERGPELLQMGSAGGYVYPSVGSYNSAASGGSSQQVEFRVTGAADSAVAQLIHALQRKGALQIFSSAIVTR